MRKLGNLYLNDPPDLGQSSSSFMQLFMQLGVLDFARRYYKRLNDTTSKRRSKEIANLLHKISEMQTIAVRAYIPPEMIDKHLEYQEKSHLKYGR